jgi:oligopeptidase B
LNDSNVPAWQGAKLVAKMKDEGDGGNLVLLRVQTDAGHGGRTVPQQIAQMADLYTFFLSQMNMMPVESSISDLR